ncbi:deoxycytidylate deaminase [Burkholderia sp. HI2500]|nr:deoxycytidylate deaminase [Burkholderia sp. HI2500]
MGPKQNTNYLKSAVAQIYGDDDDFIVIGLTGRTGSGCSTVAKIFQSRKEEIRHNLFFGNDPHTNEQRKERILQRHFEATWTPFLLLQVRAIITTFLLDQEGSFWADKFSDLFESDAKRMAFADLLDELRVPYTAIRDNDKSTDPIEYYTQSLPIKCEALREILGESSFVKLYQIIGKNIRLSGDPFAKTMKDGAFFALAERINFVIKLIHDARKNKGDPTYIVVDAIRNPLEAVFFQDRYAAFYLLAVSAPEDDRLARLRELKYSEIDIESIDKIEYTTHDLDDLDFYSVQDIQSCLQRADLYVSNPNVSSKVAEYQDLTNQLIKFVSLIRRPGIVTPSAVERCMQIAYTAKLNSGCISRQVGAVVTDANYSLRSIGWNDAPFGHVPCNLRSRNDLLQGNDKIAYSDFEKNDEKYLGHFKERSKRFDIVSSTGRNNAFCFKSEYNAFKNEKNQVHTRSLHAEENAFLQVAKYGLASIEGGLLFTTASPCELCSKKAYQLGIRKIYYVDPYPGIALDHILKGGSNNPELLLFSGAIGRAFHKLYSPIVPYKDELNAVTA